MAKRPRDSVEREIMDIIPERFDGDLEGGGRGGGRMRLVLSIALGFLVIAALGVAGRHLLVGEGQQAQTEASVPVIKADEKPIKTKPEDRGGMEVPNQDKLVYQDIGKGEAQGTGGAAAEKLLPPAEKPQMPAMKSGAVPSDATASAAMPPPAASAEIPAPPAVAGPPAAETPPAASAPAAAPQPAPAPAAAPTASAPATAGKGTSASASKPQQLAAAAPAPAPAAASPAAKTALAAAGNYQVQLAAMKSEAEAQAVWKKALAANKDLLGSLTEEVVRADLGAKGVYFRLRAGPLDEAAAKSLCAELTKRNQVCIVARKS